MLNISGMTDGFTLDLNESMESEYTLFITSESDKGRSLPFGVISNSNIDNIYTSLAKGNELTLVFNLNGIKTEQSVWLKNSHKEYYKITILPNTEASRDKLYTFKIGKTSVDGKKITVNVISKETKYAVPWEITYSGAPYEYKVQKKKTKFTAELVTDIPTSATSVFKLSQEESGNELSFNLFHANNNSVELIKG